MTEIRTQRLLTKKYQEDAKFDDNKANGFLRKRIEPQNEFIDQMMEKYEAGNATTGLEKAESEDKPIKYARGTDEGGADREGVVKDPNPGFVQKAWMMIFFWKARVAARLTVSGQRSAGTKGRC